MHIMLDLETWGNEPGRDIRSIGACVFDPQTGYTPNPNNGGKEFSDCFYRATDNPVIGNEVEGWSKGHYDPIGQVYRRYDLSRDSRTVQWWADQSEAARAAFTDPVDLREALTAFANWLCRVAYPAVHIYDSPIFSPISNIRLWSHGSHYDGPILAACYRAVGLPVPWHYRAPRDTRTIFDAAGIDPERWYDAVPQMGTYHNALDDAINQARAVCEAFGRLASK